MKTSSAKAKGRRCAQEVVDLLYLYAPDLQPGDIFATPSGVTGVDVCLSPAAEKVYPLTIECKNQEALNIWAAYEQACSHRKGEKFSVPILFFKRNRSNLLVCLAAEDFMKLIT